MSSHWSRMELQTSFRHRFPIQHDECAFGTSATDLRARLKSILLFACNNNVWAFGHNISSCLLTVCQSRATLIFNRDYAVDLLRFNIQSIELTYSASRLINSQSADKTEKRLFNVHVPPQKLCNIRRSLLIFISDSDNLNDQNPIYSNFYHSFLFADMPTQMPPLTPGTNKKLTEVLKASFASWEKEVQNCNITKGTYIIDSPAPPPAHAISQMGEWIAFGILSVQFSKIIQWWRTQQKVFVVVVPPAQMILFVRDIRRKKVANNKVSFAVVSCVRYFLFCRKSMTDERSCWYIK